MLKKILGKDGNEKKEPIEDEELKKLREKFKEVTQQGTSAKKETASPEETAQPASAQQQPQQTARPATTIQQQTMPPQDAFIDPERFEENERITNLIMQQIKELIEIDNNLNIKLKELESKIGNNISNVTDMKNVVDKFNSRLEFIEKNMEKFMGLYEVVTNRFNPFVAEEDVPEEKPIEGPVKIPETRTHDAVSKQQPTQTENRTITQEEPIQSKDAAGKTSQETVEKDNKAEESNENTAKKETSTQAEKQKDEPARTEKEGRTQDNDEITKKVSGITEQDDKKKDSTADEIRTEDNISHEAETSKTADREDKTGNNENISEEAPKDTTSESTEVHPDFHFELPDGTEIRSLEGLVSALKDMDESIFRTHVDDDHNDFADWIGLVMGDDSLAEKMRSMKTREALLKALEDLYVKKP